MNVTADPFPGMSYPGPPVFDEKSISFEADYACAAIAAFFASLMVSAFLATDYTGLRKSLRFVSASFLLGIFATILLTLCSRAWLQSTVEVRALYKAYAGDEVTVRVGIHVGQTGINVTMKGLPEDQIGEHIDYNEEFEWASPSRATFPQGRFGFGMFSNRLNQGFRRGQYRGLPLPILYVAEWLTFDGDGIRWGRYYRLAGYYSFILEYTALGFFALSVMFGVFRLRLGSVLLMTTGVVLTAAAVVYIILIESIPAPLTIPVGEGLEDGPDGTRQVQVLTPKYSWALWLTLGTGLVTIVVSSMVFVLVTAAETRHRISEEDKASADPLERLIERVVPKRISVAVHELMDEN
mmetsp:Transcript_12924/g.31953  ORF Transcript_12924/g.31953 Transcript_12924/m.31953 type:complete len:352 (-) Transcript_12924:43-1098(-)